MKIEQVICDQCGARKQESNYWFWLEVTNYGFHLYTPEAGPGGVEEMKDICSQGCAIKALSEFLDPSFKERREAALNQLEVTGKVMDYYAEKFKSYQHAFDCPAQFVGTCNCKPKEDKQ